ncbi:MAG: pyridoxal phosphate-dependent aminotransferase [Deltaproteobacteria bacterium]|nr:pyridoxal phosphate-dependent aminotransferase [Deltaproteobacteria bacterium]
MRVADRMNRIPASQTMAITMKAMEMKARGIDVIGFGAGEPDFDTPKNIKDAAIRAIEEGFTKYTQVGGIPELKKAVCEKFRHDNGLEYTPDNIVVSAGGKHSLYNLFHVLFQKGDEVIIPAPYWVSYPPIAILAEATPVILPTNEEGSFKLTPGALEEAITPRTRGLVINSPCNPTGAAYTRSEMENLMEAVLKHPDIWVISDDIYEKIVYDGLEFVNPANIGEEAKARTIVLNGVSKSYAMTGWRIGYAAAPKEIAAAMSKLQGQNTGNPCSIAQKAAVEALAGSQDSVEAMRREFQKRRDYIVNAFNQIPGVSCFNPQGAFYVFPNISSLLGREIRGKTLSNSTAFSEFMLEEARVALVAGEAFGAENYIRLSYATSMENIQEGMRRIRKALEA